MLNLQLHINRLTKAQLRRAKAWVAICALLLTLAQSMAGYLLVKCYNDSSSFDKEYDQSNAQLLRLHQATRNQLASLLDLDQQPGKKTSSQVAFTISFNLFVDDYRANLPDRLIGELAGHSNFEYTCFYDFLNCNDIFDPPRLS